jgi:hypothetical protein
MAIAYLPSWDLSTWTAHLPTRLSSTQSRAKSQATRRMLLQRPSCLHLPPEIWLEVFGHATWIPGALNVDDHEAITAYSSDEHAVCLQAAYNSAVETMQSIRLVCAGWLSIAAPLTLQYCMIRSGRQATRLESLLKAYAIAHPDQRSYGWYTKRLEIFLEGAHEWDILHTNTIIRILDHCPNLQIFSSAHCTVEGDIFNGSKLAARLAERRLLRLEMRADHSLILAAIGGYLRVLCITASKRISPAFKDIQLSLPALRLVILSHCDTPLVTLMKEWNMPDLTAFAIASPSAEGLPNIDSIICGIRHLALPSALSILPAMRSCHLLVSLDISLNRSALVPFGRVGLQIALRQLTIRNCVDFSRPATWYNNSQNARQHLYLRDCLNSVVSQRTFPALECIRLVLPAAHGWLPPDRLGDVPSALTDVWAPWFEECRELNIGVLAARGAEQAVADVWEPLGLWGLHSWTRLVFN